MALNISVAYTTGKTLYATLTRASDSYLWDDDAGAWAAAPDAADAQIALTESEAPSTGYYTGTPSASIGSPGTVTVQIHEGTTVIGADEVYVLANAETTPATTILADTSLWNLLRYIDPLLVDCPENLQKQALRLAAREFLMATEVWEEEITVDVPDTMESAGYTPVSAYGAYAGRFLDVLMDDVFQYGWRVAVDGALFLADDTTMGTHLTVFVVWFPKTNCSTLPQWILDRYGPGIAAGALARLFSMKKPWKDPDMYQTSLAEYRDALGQARMEKQKGRTAEVFYLTPPTIM